MKKLVAILSLGLILSSCEKEFIGPFEGSDIIPSELAIHDVVGIKVESSIVSEEVRMNVKLPYSGTYRIKIRDIGKELISQEKIQALEGDNLLKVYVSSLPNDGYTLELTDDNHKVLGMTTIVVNH